MKKLALWLILAALCLVCAPVAQAQPASGPVNLSWLESYIPGQGMGGLQVEQQGLGQVANLEQSGVGAVWGLIQQSGANNQAFYQRSMGPAYFQIRQDGSYHTAGLSQFSLGCLPNQAEISQTGSASWLSAGQTGWDNRLQVSQTGQGSEAEITQFGVGNLAVVDQYASGGQRNRAELRQRGLLLESFITQSGSGNVAGLAQFNNAVGCQAAISQDGDSLLAVINQMGLDNIAGIVQEGYGHQATINQGGYDNEAYISQFGSGPSQARINQFGHDNLAEVEAHAGGALPSVTQLGSDSHISMVRDSSGVTVITVHP
ncbi:hypothetical protein [Dethiosulfatarculus sandiegensis]|uniref:Curlin associated repeat-containing protein n=1 Tax=Dethiosulfatarculus sandiegensis TaxID=1429043 RepID=A0A0D2GD28_9BACT|nr:hypothetical protein [Dethiosulfatarculus sandiegensis]KIX12862.1 hypothetical protein X474_17535 [Dethiosulfatarculus sandiegensis]